MTRLLSALERGAGSGAEVVVIESGRARHTDWTGLHRDAGTLAGRLRSRGIGPGRTVGLLAETSVATLTALRAVLLSGAAVTVLPPPPHDDPASVPRRVGRSLAGSAADLLLVGAPFTGLAGAADALPCQVVSLSQLATEGAPAPWRPPDVDEHATAVVQLTSGTTGPPRQVRVSHHNLAANIDAIEATAGGGLGDRPRCSWLPLHHDMGLVGYAIMPMATGCRLVLRPPADFLADPLCWPRTVSEYGAVSTSSPAFGYALLARLLPAAKGLDLSTLRVALCGAEQIEPAVIEAFCAAALPFGFDPSAMVAGYGLAEATVAVAMSPPGHGLRTDLVDRASLHAGRAAPAGSAGGAVDGAAGNGSATRRLAVIGPPLTGIELAIVDSGTCRAVPERQVGEIRVRGDSVATVTGAAGAVTVDEDGWLRTGDRGYLTGGELVVCGRTKDVLMVAGRTIQPEEVELACAAVPGVRAGCVAAVPYPRPDAGTEGVAVVAEIRRGHQPDQDDTAGRIRDTVRQIIGVSPDLVRLVPPGSVPKTTSGKLRRHRVASQLLDTGAGGSP